MIELESSSRQQKFTHDIRNLVERYAFIYSIFKFLVDYEAERLFPSAQNQSAHALSSICAQSLLSQLKEFRQEVPFNLAIAVDGSLAEMENRTMSAFQKETQPAGKKDYTITDLHILAIRILAEQYAELKYAYDALVAVRHEDRGTAVERNLAAKLGQALRRYNRQITYLPEAEVMKDQ